MAIPKASFHVRSISLPSTSHPQDVSIEDHLRRLRSSQASPSSSSSICQNLCGLKDLNEQMNNLIHLPHNQKSLCKGEVEKVLEGSLAILDVSSFALDAVPEMKESILDLQSCLRRGNNGEGIHAYSVSRMRISKMVSKYLANLKKADKIFASLENDDTTMRMLKEAEAISLSMLKSVLSFVMGKKATSWSMVAKLVKSKHASGKSDETSEVEEVDSTLSSVSQKHLGVDSEVLLKQLEALETIICELEEGLGAVSRTLTQTRVSPPQHTQPLILMY